ncbi:hypothetical protein D1872_334640 [compost metagenome]
MNELNSGFERGRRNHFLAFQQQHGSVAKQQFQEESGDGKPAGGSVNPSQYGAELLIGHGKRTDRINGTGHRRILKAEVYQADQIV